MRLLVLPQIDGCLDVFPQAHVLGQEPLDRTCLLRGAGLFNPHPGSLQPIFFKASKLEP